MKKTKIVCTISDIRCEVPFLQDLYDRGMNVVRMNTAHATDEGLHQLISNVREVSTSIPILIDTKGPEIRTTTFADGFKEKCIVFEPGERVRMVGNPTGTTSHDEIAMSYANFVSDVPVGANVLIDDGEIAFTVVAKESDTLIAEVRNHGELGQRKSVNVPGVSINLPSLTDKDRHNINLAIDEDIDFIAHSFVRSKQDILDIQQILDERQSKIKIIAKIENQQGVDNIDEILDVAYGVMVARGDLGIEVPQERIPEIQRMLIRKCMVRAKPVIVATQMLHSMIKNPRPTRAEISDIANAVFAQTDAVMLSGETAYGAYPREAVQTMAQVCREAEAEYERQEYEMPSFFDKVSPSISSYLCKHAAIAQQSLGVKAFIIETRYGCAARMLSSYRPKGTIYALCHDMKAVRLLSLTYGVDTELVEASDNHFIYMGLSSLVREGKVQKDDLMAYLFGATEQGISSLEINKAEKILKES